MKTLKHKKEGILCFSDFMLKHSLHTIKEQKFLSTSPTLSPSDVRPASNPKRFMLSGVSLLAVSNVNKLVGFLGLPYVMWSAHFFVTHIQTERPFMFAALC